MRTYALYDRSRKVLALYIVIVVIAVGVDSVSLNLRGNQYPVSHPIADLLVYSGREWFQIKINLKTGKYP